MGIIWTIIIGFVIGAFVPSFLGQSPGWYGPDDGTGLIGAVISAIIVLLLCGFARHRA
ncbi:MAG: GlsB/YeaQ/YmgE family stress response membrane protein [Tabrizicola sp.]|nr:GlsB/YeaQ/YmgE family stress response membrane protein [Tabrizicola sp.]